MQVYIYVQGKNDIDDFVFLFEIEITNANSSKIDFSDGMVDSSILQGSNLRPGVVGWIVLEHLQTSKTSPHQSKNFTQYLISDVTPIVATGDNRLLVQVTSSKTGHRPGLKFTLH